MRIDTHIAFAFGVLPLRSAITFGYDGSPRKGLHKIVLLGDNACYSVEPSVCKSTSSRRQQY